MSAKPRRRAPKIKVRGEIRVNTYRVLTDSVEEGIRWGISRWLRKGIAPEGWTPEMAASLEEHLDREIGNAVCERLIFGDGADS